MPTQEMFCFAKAVINKSNWVSRVVLVFAYICAKYRWMTGGYKQLSLSRLWHDWMTRLLVRSAKAEAEFGWRHGRSVGMMGSEGLCDYRCSFTMNDRRAIARPETRDISFQVIGLGRKASSSWITSFIELKSPCQHLNINQSSGIDVTSGKLLSAYSSWTWLVPGAEFWSSWYGCNPVMTSWIAQPNAKMSVFRVTCGIECL